jgi:hypothetical protein
LASVAELVEAAIEETLAYYAFPGALAADSHQQRGAFPDGQSALNLAAASLRHIAGTA